MGKGAAGNTRDYCAVSADSRGRSWIVREDNVARAVNTGRGLRQRRRRQQRRETR